MSEQPRRLRVLLELRDAGLSGDAPAVIRLRHVLKSLLRRYQFRCVSAKQLEGPVMGTHEDDAKLIPCPRCNGEGTVPCPRTGGELECPTCGGLGKVVEDDDGPAAPPQDGP